MPKGNCVAGTDGNAQHQVDMDHAYKMGYDCGLNGANTTNCDFHIFSSLEFTTEWERGQKQGDKERVSA